MTALLAIDSGQSGVRAKLPSGVVRVFAGIRTDAALFPQLAAVVEAALGAPFPEAVGVAADGESAGAASGARPFGDDAFPPAQSAAVAIGTTG
ncbi:MAG: hypothetical protein LBR32_01765, partial [Propionibacteriaceae bacterium]|nr:hypothetical protein [Propionibacteriaceae bacterium]